MPAVLHTCGTAHSCAPACPALCCTVSRSVPCLPSPLPCSGQGVPSLQEALAGGPRVSSRLLLYCWNGPTVACMFVDADGQCMPLTTASHSPGSLSCSSVLHQQLLPTAPIFAAAPRATAAARASEQGKLWLLAVSDCRWARCRAQAEHGPRAKHDTGHLVDISQNCTFTPPSAPLTRRAPGLAPGSCRTAGAAPLAASRISCNPGGGWLPHRDLQLPPQSRRPHLHMNHPHSLARVPLATSPAQTPRPASHNPTCLRDIKLDESHNRRLAKLPQLKTQP